MAESIIYILQYFGDLVQLPRPLLKSLWRHIEEVLTLASKEVADLKLPVLDDIEPPLTVRKVVTLQGKLSEVIESNDHLIEEVLV